MKVEVSSLQKLHSELQEQLKSKETEFKAHYEEKLTKKLNKERQQFDDELHHAYQQLQQLANERDELRHKAYTF